MWSLLVIVGCARDRLPHTVDLPEAGSEDGQGDDAALADFVPIGRPSGGARGNDWVPAIRLRPANAPEARGGDDEGSGEATSDPPASQGGASCFDFEGCQEHLLPTGCLLSCDIALSWVEAAAACMDIDGRLAVPTTAAVNHLLRPPVGGRRWIGMSDLDEEGRFQDLSGDSGGWSNWGSGEPNNQGDDEDCAEMLPTGRWNDAPCGRAQPFACDLVPFHWGAEP